MTNEIVKGMIVVWRPSLGAILVEQVSEDARFVLIVLASGNPSSRNFWRHLLH